MPTDRWLAPSLAECIEALDWSTSPLGPREGWSQSLRTTVGLILPAQAQIVLFWGPDFVALYNDAYAPTIGDKHPSVLGRPAAEGWSELWDDLGPLLRGVRETGQTFFAKDRPFYIERHGYGETVYFDVSYSAVPEADGSVGGVLCIVSETTERVRAEAQLRESEARFRQLAETINQVFYIKDLPGQRLLYLSPAFERVWGRPASELIEDFGRFGETIHPDDRDRVLMLIPRQERGEPIEVEYRIVRPDDSIRYIHDRSFPVRADGIKRCVGIAEDVTARKQAAARFEGVFNSELMGFSIFDVTTAETLAVNDRFLSLTGHTRADFEEGRWDWREFTLVEYLWKDERAIAQARERGWWDPYEKEYRRRDGTIFPVRIASAPMPGDPGCVVVSIEDISAQRAAETALRDLNATLEKRVAEALAEKKLFADIIETTDAPVQAIDRAFRFMAINATAQGDYERLFGVRPQIGQSLLDLLAHLPDQQAAARQVWSRVLAGETYNDLGWWGSTDENRRAYEMRFRPLCDPEGKQFGAYLFGYDVTERLREQERLAAAEEQLRQSQKMEAMGQLTGGVAHDFNNLLTPIVGSLDMLLRKGIGNEREQRLIAGAAQSAERAKILVQRLLAFARRQPLQPSAVDIGALMRGMAELITSTIGPQVQLEVDIAENLPAAQADQNQLEMALLNLAVNARDAMPQGGTLRISASAEHVGAQHRAQLRAGAYVRLSVVDDGTGMDSTTLKHAIEPFFSTKGVGKGTGLGLSMVHGLASQLGGALTIQSRVGVGTVIDLWLPVSSQSTALSNINIATVLAPKAVGTVLLVDDEELVRMSTADMLADLGYVVVEAGSAEEALRLIRDGLQPTLLVSDHLMPGMSGTDLARALRQGNPMLRTLIVSGYADVDDIASDLPRLTKPFRYDELSAAIIDFVQDG